jgi:hypothetical protein
MLIFIKNMYSNIKSKIKTNAEYTQIFSCLPGVRQGEILSFTICDIFK